MDRLKSIDVFRGLAIALMALFTLMNVLGGADAGWARHNVPGELHPGDFVLPLFLFASGASVPFFVEKRLAKGRVALALDTLGRFGRLFAIGMLLSFFTAGGRLGGMDEITLSALLFLPAVALSRADALWYAALSAAIALAYHFAAGAGWTAGFYSVYLGGYPAAIFYLPVTLAGAALGRAVMGNREGAERACLALFSISMAAALALLPFFPMDKMAASPAFMALSAALCSALFLLIWLLVERMGIAFRPLAYLGRNPIRYWVLMWVAIVVPIYACALADACPYPLGLGQAWAVAASFLCLLALAGISLIIDRLAAKLGGSQKQPQ